MRIGIPKETSLEEKRVGLAPAGVDALVKAGHVVYIESGAGAESRFSDEQYRKTGAHIVYSAEEVFQRAELVAKVAPLNETEAKMLQEGQILFSFLHLALSKKNILENLLHKKVTAIAYELIENKTGLPVLQSMSEIAGQIAVQMGERFFCSDYPFSRGVLLGGITGVSPAAVVIIGAGVVGMNAARAALGKGAHVIMLDKDLDRLKRCEDLFHKNVTTVVANPYTIARGVKFADLLIGAVHVKGEKMPHIVSEEMIKTMKPGAIIVDVSIDQGGCIETSRPTTLSEPVFVEHDVVHFCVPNIPAFASRTASYGLTNASIDYISRIADTGLAGAVQSDDGLSKGVCTYNGFCAHEAIARTFDVEFRRLHIFSTN